MTDPKLLRSIEWFKHKLESYGFRTDYDEVYEQLGLAVLVLLHEIPYFRTNLLGTTIRADLMYIPYRNRKRILKHLRKLFVEDVRRQRAHKTKERQTS